MSDLNGAGSSPVVRRDKAEWRAIMADHEASGMTRPGFRESRGLPRKTFRNRRRRLGHPVAGKAGSFIEVAPPSMPGRDIGPEPGGGIRMQAKPADMRKSLDGLRAPVQTRPGENPACGRRHVFPDRRRTMIRVPGAGRGGVFIRARRLEQGLSASLPGQGQESLSPSPTGLTALPEGAGFTVRRRRKRHVLPLAA